MKFFLKKKELQLRRKGDMNEIPASIFLPLESQSAPWVGECEVRVLRS